MMAALPPPQLRLRALARHRGPELFDYQTGVDRRPSHCEWGINLDIPTLSNRFEHNAMALIVQKRNRDSLVQESLEK